MTLYLNSILAFGKYKDNVVSDLLPSDITSEIEAVQFRPIIKYFSWIRRETSYVLSEEIVDRIKEILSKMPKRKESSSYGRGNYEHYNDIGAMNGLSFQDLYGDFGY